MSVGGSILHWQATSKSNASPNSDVWSKLGHYRIGHKVHLQLYQPMSKIENLLIYSEKAHKIQNFVRPVDDQKSAAKKHSITCLFYQTRQSYLFAECENNFFSLHWHSVSTGYKMLFQFVAYYGQPTGVEISQKFQGPFGLLVLKN